ncbi:MAG: hypothetical protein ACR2OR_11105 [Hyphomicrobiales bacterium]
MAISKLFLATAVTVSLTASAMAAFAPATSNNAEAVMVSHVPQRMAVVQKLPENPLKREVMEDHCHGFQCQEI